MGAGSRSRGPLPEVVEQEAGKDEGVPRPLDGPATEMAHVGVERLHAGDGQDHGPEDEDDLDPVHRDELDCMAGVHRRKDNGVDGGSNRDRRGRW